MEEQIQKLSDIKITITPIMMMMSVFVSFAIQFIKAILERWSFFSADEIKKTLFPMITIALTMAAFYLAGVTEWPLAGAVMGLAASGGYTSFSGSAGLVKKPPAVLATTLLLCVMLLLAGCSQVQMSPPYRQNLEMTNIVVQSLNEDCQAGDPNACSKGLAESAEILQLLVDAVHGTTLKGGQQ